VIVQINYLTVDANSELELLNVRPSPLWPSADASDRKVLPGRVSEYLSHSRQCCVRRCTYNPTCRCLVWWWHQRGWDHWRDVQVHSRLQSVAPSRGVSPDRLRWMLPLHPSTPCSHTTEHTTTQIYKSDSPIIIDGGNLT